MDVKQFIKDHPMDLVKSVYWQKERKIKIAPCHTNRASSLGHSCERYLVLTRTAWDKKIPHDIGLQLIFDEGEIQENAVIRDLIDAGVKVTEQQKAFEWPKFQITGHLDLMVECDGWGGPVEIKSMNPHIFDSINSLDDFKKYPWTARYIAQMQIYLLMNNSENGYFLLKNKSTGELRQIEIRLDYEFAESLLKKAERVNAHIENKTLPDFVKDPDECKRCAFFGHVCNPPLEFDAPVISDDPGLLEMLDRRAEIKEFSTEYNRIDKKIKERFKADEYDGKSFVCGSHLIDIKKGFRNGYTVADTETFTVKIRSVA